MKLTYEAYDVAGKAVRDTIDASTPEAATEALRDRGLFVTSIETARNNPSGDAAPARKPGWRPTGATGRLKSVAMFTRQLYVLVSTGTPLTESLYALERQTRDPGFVTVIADLRRRVEEGATLSEALRHHRGWFDTIYVSLVAAGETGGKFEPILNRLSSLVRKQLQTRQTILGAMTYPVLLLGVSGVVLLLMLMFVLPRFAGLFETLDVPLPPTTAALMWISNALQHYWWLIGGSVIGAGVGLFYYLKTDGGKRMLDTVMIRVPIVGPIARNFIVARIVRLFGVLMDSYVPLLEVLALTRDAAGNCHYHALLTRAAESVERGEPISSAFDDPTLVTPSVTEAIRSGESTGRLSEMLLNMADFLDEENDVMLRALTSILEPVILIVLGVLVGLVALSMFMPLFDLTSMTGAGG